MTLLPKALIVAVAMAVSTATMVQALTRAEMMGMEEPDLLRVTLEQMAAMNVPTAGVDDLQFEQLVQLNMMLSAPQISPAALRQTLPAFIEAATD